MENKKRRKLWGRMGMTIEVDAELWKKDNEAAVLEAIQSGHAKFDGESYFPENVDENDNEEVGLDLSGVVKLVEEMS